MGNEIIFSVPSALVWIGTVVVVTVSCMFGFKQALSRLLVGVLLCPMLAFAGRTIRVELVLVPIFFAIAVVSFPKQLARAVRRPASLVLIAWLFWIILASMINSRGRAPSSIAWWFELYGLVRLVIVYWLFSLFRWRPSEVESLVKWLALASILVCLLSVGQVLNLPGARAITLAGYVPVSSPVFQQQLEKETSGYVFRSLGVFGNVSPNAYYFAIAAGCCFLSLVRNSPVAPRKGFWVICGAACLIGGMSTMSGTFIAGLPIVVLASLGFVWRRMTARQLVVVVSAVAAISVVTTVAIVTIPRLKVQYDYQLEGLLSGERFKSRYDDEIGVTHEAAQVITENPLLGGFGFGQDVFVGDSIIMLLGFYGGYCGATLFVLFLAAMSSYTVLRGATRAYATLWVWGAVIFGVSTTSVFTLRLSDWWWAMMGIASVQAMRGHSLTRAKHVEDLAYVLPVSGGEEYPRQNILN